MIEFGLVGTGWRSEFYLRIAAELPEVFRCVGVVTRDVAGRSEWARRFTVPLFGSIDEMLRTPLSFVVVSVTRAAAPAVIRALADRGVPILAETPPANDHPDLVDLYRLAAQGARIAVAEQFHLQPHHRARIALAAGGRLGRVVQAQVSGFHGYHGVSLIRRLLGIGAEDVTITASTFVSPVLQGRNRYAAPDREVMVPSTQVSARLDFGDRLAVHDFTDVQYHSAIRGQRVLVRGERGEIRDDSVVYMSDHRTPISVALTRSNAGERGNLEGLHLRGILAGAEWLYVNPFAPARFSDEEIAIASCLGEMAAYVDGHPPFYSLAEACQDRYLDLLIAEAAATGAPVRSEPQPWAAAVGRMPS